MKRLKLAQEKIDKWPDITITRFTRIFNIIPEIGYFATDFELWSYEQFKNNDEYLKYAEQLIQQLDSCSKKLYETLQKISDFAQQNK